MMLIYVLIYSSFQLFDIFDYLNRRSQHRVMPSESSMRTYVTAHPPDSADDRNLNEKSRERLNLYRETKTIIKMNQI